MSYFNILALKFQGNFNAYLGFTSLEGLIFASYPVYTKLM